MSYDSTILAEPNLTAYYPLNEQSGTLAHDISPNAFNGTLHGGIQLNQAALANNLDPCMLFNGTSGYISLPSGVQVPEPLTIELWLKAISIAAGGIVFYGTWDSATHGYEIGIEAPTPSYYVALNGGSTNSGNSDFSIGTVYYIAVTIDASQNMVGYLAVVGGTATQKVSANPGGTLNYGTTVPFIGARYNGGAPALFFNGSLSSLAVYGGRLLTPATMNAHIALGSLAAAPTVPINAYARGANRVAAHSPWIVGDAAPAWVISLIPDSGFVNTTGMLASNFSLRIRNNNTATETTGAGTFSNITNGSSSTPATVTYQPTAADVGTLGNFTLFLDATFANGVETFTIGQWQVIPE